MEQYTVRNLTFEYAGQTAPVLQEISFSLSSGEFVVLCGPSGCGKSTLLRQLKPVLTPAGMRSGELLYEGESVEQLSERRQAAEIGFVGQSPENQLVTDKVWHELAFGLESLGESTERIRRKIAEMASFFGMEGWFEKEVQELSGGQKQMLNLASVLVMAPQILILDEPTSQLDPIAAEEFLQAVAKVNREMGVTILITEHRLEEALPLCSRMLVMEHGKLIYDGSVQAAGEQLRQEPPAWSAMLPTAVQVWMACAPDADAKQESELFGQNVIDLQQCPVTVGEGRQWLETYEEVYGLNLVPAEDATVQVEGSCCLKAENVWFRYEKESPDVLRGAKLELRAGEFLAVLGANGTGKSTLLSVLCGVRKPSRGKVTKSGRIGLLPQNPELLFSQKTVLAEVREQAEPEKADEMLKRCLLESVRGQHPFDLSGGEKQRLALAKVLLTEPEILVLDEPTKGMDGLWKVEFAQMLREITDAGTPVLMVSHDVEFCARYAHRCALLFDGGIVCEEPTRQFFSGNRFYTTAAHRMAGRQLPEAILPEDIIAACQKTGGEKEKKNKGAQNQKRGKKSEEKPEKKMSAKEMSRRGQKQRASAKSWCMALCFLLLIPATIWIGASYLQDQKYLFISLLVLLEAIVPFFVLYEGRKPQARELVLLATLCTIGVLGRTAFYMLPQVKPVLALVILTGVAFGAQTGFLMGAMTMLLSNVIFGQGPWTPWQMFAMGIIGCLAGLLYYGKHPHVIRLMVFGFIAAIVVYGGLMNGASAIMAHAVLNPKTLLAYYISGFPMDVIHGGSTAVFLLLGTEPLLSRLERMKIKYGLLAGG